MDELFNLCRKTAVSGSEYYFAEYLKNEIFDKFCDETVIDNIGNLIAVINKGKNKKIMIEAHIDEIGLMVKNIDKDGFIHFVSIGGIDTAILPSMEVTIHGKSDIFGVIGAKPPHLQSKEEKEQKYKIEDLYIDTGFSNEELSEIVSLGDLISFVSEPINLCNNFFTSKSIDNRMGVYVLSECLKRLKGKNIDAEITGLCAAQEEVGCRGATVGSYKINPDYAFIVDVTHGISPYIDETMGFSLNSGIAVGIGPNLHSNYTNELISKCIENKIPYTLEVLNGNSGTDAWVIQTTKNGIPCVLLSAPLRYMHTSVETLCKDDIEKIINAICIMIKGGEKDA